MSYENRIVHKEATGKDGALVCSRRKFKGWFFSSKKWSEVNCKRCLKKK